MNDEKGDILTNIRINSHHDIVQYRRQSELSVRIQTLIQVLLDPRLFLQKLVS